VRAGLILVDVEVGEKRYGEGGARERQGARGEPVHFAQNANEIETVTK